MKIGCIGLGVMGYRLATRLTTRYQPIAVWDLDPYKISQHTHHYPSISSTVEDMAQQSHIIVTCLPTSQQVEEITNQLLKVVEKHPSSLTHVLDCTSGNYRQTQIISQKLQQHDITLLDCPVSGGTVKAHNGTLSCLVGGEKSHFTKVKPILETFSTPIHTGPVGSGHAIKSVNNLLNVSHLVLAMEGLCSLQDEMGIPLETSLTSINQSSGRSLISLERIPQEVLTQKYQYDFLLQLMKKDVDLALQLIGRTHLFEGISQVVNNTLDTHTHPRTLDYTEVARFIQKHRSND